MAEHPQVAADGEQWANLCDYHDERLRTAVDDPPRMLSFWILAQGGKEVAVKRFVGDDH
jgi:hypothetical protein